VSLQVGRALGLAVVAEGVEDRSELEDLGRHGCDAVQGVYISRPLSAGDFMTWLIDRAQPSYSAAVGEGDEVAHDEIAGRRDR
jgi:EAL domain-containing protein (putative c-di-GMP-specific phosphodiesterase class I)